jgi:hypothetical protein
VDSLDKLVLSSRVDQNTVTETLTELHSRGVIAFDKSSGAIHILKDFEI